MKMDLVQSFHMGDTMLMLWVQTRELTSSELINMFVISFTCIRLVLNLRTCIWGKTGVSLVYHLTKIHTLLVLPVL